MNQRYWYVYHYVSRKNVFWKINWKIWRLSPWIWPKTEWGRSPFRSHSSEGAKLKVWNSSCPLSQTLALLHGLKSSTIWYFLSRERWPFRWSWERILSVFNETQAFWSASIQLCLGWGEFYTNFAEEKDLLSVRCPRGPNTTGRTRWVEKKLWSAWADCCGFRLGKTPRPSWFRWFHPRSRK